MVKKRTHLEDTGSIHTRKSGIEKRITGKPEEISPSQEIDAIISKSDDWRGKTLSKLRSVIKGADASIIEEVKWKKPSRPEGVPVWSSEGIICVADTLKEAVRLTFPKGALIRDQMKTFNTRLESKSVRAIDYRQNTPIDESVLTALIKEAIHLNTQRINSKRSQ